MRTVFSKFDPTCTLPLVTLQRLCAQSTSPPTYRTLTVQLSNVTTFESAMCESESKRHGAQSMRRNWKRFEVNCAPKPNGANRHRNRLRHLHPCPLGTSRIRSRRVLPSKLWMQFIQTTRNNFAG